MVDSLATIETLLFCLAVFAGLVVVLWLPIIAYHLKRIADALTRKED